MEEILSLFYSTRYQTIHLFTYLCVPSLIQLIKTNKYLYHYKEILYKLVIVRLSSLIGIIHEINYKKYYSNDIIKSIIKKINNNNYLSKKRKNYLTNIYINILVQREVIKPIIKKYKITNN